MQVVVVAQQAMTVRLGAEAPSLHPHGPPVDGRLTWGCDWDGRIGQEMALLCGAPELREPHRDCRSTPRPRPAVAFEMAVTAL